MSAEAPGIPTYSGYSCAGCGSSETGRNLVVCIDGTSNKFSVNNTNIVELYCHLHSDATQFTYYNSGIGTYARPSFISLHYIGQLFHNAVDLAFARKLEKIVLGAYRWLSENHQKGDRIYLFGFSRGAYQVRVLSAMIDRVGLIRRGNEEQISFAFQLYAELSDTKDVHEEPKTSGKSSKRATVEDPDKLATAFKRTFSRDSVKVHFVGAWDTVSSVGLGRHKLLPSSANGMGHVCFFRHALALDERRVKFLPEYAHGGTTLPPSGSEPSSEPSEDRRGGEDSQYPHTKEVWFRGSHSDIGGGNVENVLLDKGNPSLRWMSYEATRAGLRMTTFETSNFHGWGSDSNAPKPSLKGVWWLLELLPLPRLSYRDQRHTTYIPHVAKGRKMKPGQLVHSTVIQLPEPETQTTPADGATRLLQRPYRPFATLPKELREWGKFGENKRTGQDAYLIDVEKDFSNMSEHMLNRLRSPDDQGALRDYEMALSSAEHSRALYDLDLYLKASQMVEGPSQGQGDTTEDRSQTRDLLLSERFQQIIKSKLSRSGRIDRSQMPTVSLSIQRDIRLYSFCVRLFGLPQQHSPVRVSAFYVDSGSEKQDSQVQDADVHISVNEDNQNLNIIFQGSDFSKTRLNDVVYTCALDDHKNVFAVLRRASYFFANLRPSQQMDTTPHDITLLDIQGRPSNPRDGVFHVERGSYSCTIVGIEKRYSHAFIFRFHADLSIESYDAATVEPTSHTLNFDLPDCCLHPFRRKCASVHKVILTTKDVPELKYILQEYMEPGEVGSKFNEWRPERKETPYAIIMAILSSAKVEWTEDIFCVVQEETKHQAPFGYERYTIGPLHASAKSVGEDDPLAAPLGSLEDTRQLLSSKQKERKHSRDKPRPRVSALETRIPIGDVGSRLSQVVLSPLTPKRTTSEIKNERRETVNSVKKWVDANNPSPDEAVLPSHSPSVASSNDEDLDSPKITDSPEKMDVLLPEDSLASPFAGSGQATMWNYTAGNTVDHQHQGPVVVRGAGQNAASFPSRPLDHINTTQPFDAAVSSVVNSPMTMTNSDMSPRSSGAEDIDSPISGHTRSTSIAMSGQSAETAGTSEQVSADDREADVTTEREETIMQEAKATRSRDMNGASAPAPVGLETPSAVTIKPAARRST